MRTSTHSVGGRSSSLTYNLLALFWLKLKMTMLKLRESWVYHLPHSTVCSKKLSHHENHYAMMEFKKLPRDRHEKYMLFQNLHWEELLDILSNGPSPSEPDFEEWKTDTEALRSISLDQLKNEYARFTLEAKNGNITQTLVSLNITHHELLRVVFPPHKVPWK